MEPLKILVPVNGDTSDEYVVRQACSLAKKSRATVFVVNVLEVGRNLPVESPEPSQIERGETILKRVEEVARHEKCPIEVELLQAREAGPAVVQEAIERKADLIVMGLPYKRRHGEFDLGTTVPYVLKNAPCRVWLSREPIVNGSGGTR